jgi:hypothetical protein
MFRFADWKGVAMAESTPNFNTVIPEKIMTPDQVSTRLGTLEFFDGMPTDATAATLLDHLTFIRGVLTENDDGSIDLYFGPKPPEGFESNWTQTVPGKGWFTLLRLYGPLEPWFDQTWRPGEFELLA